MALSNKDLAPKNKKIPPMKPVGFIDGILCAGEVLSASERRWLGNPDFRSEGQTSQSASVGRNNLLTTNH